MTSPVLGRTIPATATNGLQASYAYHVNNENGAIAVDLGDNLSNDGTGFACGHPVLAVEAGTVRVLGSDWWGNHGVILYSTSGHTYMYAHMKSLMVTNGQPVNEGEIIGAIGREGQAFGCHLHFMASDRPHDDDTLTRNRGTAFLYQVANEAKAIQTAAPANGGASVTLPPINGGGGNGVTTPNAPKPIVKANARQRPSETILSFLVDRAVVTLSAVSSGGISSGTLDGNTKATADALHAKLPSQYNTTDVIAGIMGNVAVESGFDPHIHQTGGPAQGLFQWQDSRLAALLAHFHASAITELNIDQQVEYAILELTRDVIPTYGAMPTSDAGAVASWWDQYWERSDGTARPKRVAFAQQFAGQLNINAPVTSGSSTATFQHIENEIIGNSISFYTKESFGKLGTATHIAIYNIFGDLLYEQDVAILGENQVKETSQDLDLSGEIEIGGLSNGSFADPSWVQNYNTEDKKWMDSNYQDNSGLNAMKGLLKKAGYWVGEPLVGGAKQGNKIKINDNNFKSVSDFGDNPPFTLDIKVYTSTV